MIYYKYKNTDIVLLSSDLSLSKMTLLNAVNYDSQHTSMLSVLQSGALEVYGNGWPQGGAALNVEVAESRTDNAALLSKGVQLLAVDGNIGPALAAVIHVNDKPYIFCDFEGEKFTLKNHYFSITFQDDVVLYSTECKE